MKDIKIKRQYILVLSIILSLTLILAACKKTEEITNEENNTTDNQQDDNNKEQNDNKNENENENEETTESKEIKYNFIDEINSNATGFFRVENRNNVWWIIDPYGNGFISSGINDVSYSGSTEDKDEWCQNTIDRLLSWNFNTLGAFCDEDLIDKGILPFTKVLNFFKDSDFTDVFSEEFKAEAETTAKDICGRYNNNPMLIGYFLDNEIKWAADHSSEKDLMSLYWSLPKDSLGRLEVFEFIKSFYENSLSCFNQAFESEFSSWDEFYEIENIEDVNDKIKQVQLKLKHNNIIKMLSVENIFNYINSFGSIEEYSKSMGTTFKSMLSASEKIELTQFGEEYRALSNSFTSYAADCYFKTCTSAIKKYDSNHLILGCRFDSYVPNPVLVILARYCDVVSLNLYDKFIPVEKFNNIYSASGKPLMISEFSFKTVDSGIFNENDLEPYFVTQEGRAQFYKSYAVNLLKLPYSIGYHWYKYADEPEAEASNYGLVSADNTPWEVLVDQVTQTNGQLYEMHRKIN